MAEHIKAATDPTMKFGTVNLKVISNQKISDNIKTAIYLIL